MVLIIAEKGTQPNKQLYYLSCTIKPKVMKIRLVLKKKTFLMCLRTRKPKTNWGQMKNLWLEQIKYTTFYLVSLNSWVKALCTYGSFIANVLHEMQRYSSIVFYKVFPSSDAMIHQSLNIS